jgi:hypothetical protein
LPIEKINEEETEKEFVNRVIEIANNKSVYNVVKQISTKITF